MGFTGCIVEYTLILVFFDNSEKYLLPNVLRFLTDNNNHWSIQTSLKALGALLTLFLRA